MIKKQYLPVTKKKYFWKALFFMSRVLKPLKVIRYINKFFHYTYANRLRYIRWFSTDLVGPKLQNKINNI